MAISESIQELPATAMDDDRPRGTSWFYHLSLVLALLLFVAHTGYLFLETVSYLDGPYVYPLDDTYIHLALAYNFATYGVWGVEPATFASAASSVAWPLQLAALLKVLGRQEWLPLALNMVWALVGLVGAYAICRWARLSGKVTFVVLLLATLCTPLPVLVLMGMEHSMQAAVGLLFAWQAARVLALDRVGGGQRAALCLLALLVATARFEGMFMIAAAVFVALLRWRWWDLLLIGISGALPIVVFGLISMSQGGYWLPNSVVVKSYIPVLSSVDGLFAYLRYLYTDKLGIFIGTTAVYLPVVLALLGVAVDAAGPNRLRASDRAFVLIIVLTAGMHLFAARTGTLARYEAYLVFMGIVAAAVAWSGYLREARLSLWRGGLGRAVLVGTSCVLLGVVLLVPFVQRQGEGMFIVVQACKNIHDQQIYMARFVQQYYNEEPLVLNDLGAIAWYTKAKPVDMACLATTELTRAYLEGKLDNKYLDEFARKKAAHIAVIYTHWLPEDGTPPGWIRVGRWQIKDNVICGGSAVDFYAFDDEAAATLEKNLRAFADVLPADVRQSGRYTFTKS